MLSRRKNFGILMVSVAIFLLSLMAPAPASDSAVYLKLKDSRDALLIQQREVQRSYNDMQTQIDELKRRQGILEAYLHQLERSIRDVDGAIAQLH